MHSTDIKLDILCVSSKVINTCNVMHANIELRLCISCPLQVEPKLIEQPEEELQKLLDLMSYAEQN